MKMHNWPDRATQPDPAGPAGGPAPLKGAGPATSAEPLSCTPSGRFEGDPR